MLRVTGLDLKGMQKGCEQCARVLCMLNHFPS